MFLIFADVPAYQVLDVAVFVLLRGERGDDVRVVGNMELQMHASRDFSDCSACFIFALLIFHATSLAVHSLAVGFEVAHFVLRWFGLLKFRRLS